MFETGDYIVYGNNGVCRVETVGTIELVPGIPKDRLYYTLTPIYIKGSTIYTPVDNEKVVMRPVISKTDAMELIDGIDEVETLWVSSERQREEVYKEALQTCDCRELVKMIKTIYQRKQERAAEGKKITSSDSKYFRMAEENLYGELAIPLGIGKEKVEEYIANHVKES